MNELQAYRDRVAELRDLEQEVLREAVVAKECDIFLEEATTFERTARVSEAIHSAKIAVELATARMPTKAGAALLRLCEIQARAGLTQMAASACRKALQTKPPNCEAQVSGNVQTGMLSLLVCVSLPFVFPLRSIFCDTVCCVRSVLLDWKLVPVGSAEQ